jgi:hypothetical protein
MIIKAKPQQKHQLVLGALTTLDNETTSQEQLFQMEAMNEFISFHQQFKNELTIRAKITHSTEITTRNVPKPSIEYIPTEYHHYSKVFDEEASPHVVPLLQ